MPILIDKERNESMKTIKKANYISFPKSDTEGGLMPLPVYMAGVSHGRSFNAMNTTVALHETRVVKNLLNFAFILQKCKK